MKLAREQHGLRVSENKVPRRILAVKIQKLRGSCRIMYSDEFPRLYSLSYIYADKMNEGEMGGLCSMNSINENCAQNCNHMTYFMLL
jgi:hypothetical protein